MIDQPTPSDDELPARIRALIDHFAPHDRAPVIAMHALFAAADDKGAARFDEIAVIYREDHLLLEKAAGRDAERAASVLSLDQVRAHLRDTLLPRLVAEGAVTLPAGGVNQPGAKVWIVGPMWEEMRERREHVTAVVRRRTTEVVRVQTGRSKAFTPRTQSKLTSRLEARALVKSYKKRSVVNNVALNLRQGEIVGLLGPNGAGKTTTFYMIVGLIQPQSGQIVLDGNDITDMPMYKRARAGIGYLSQEPSIFRKL